MKAGQRFAAAILLTALHVPASHGQSCEKLASLSSPAASITLASPEKAGTFTVPGSKGAPIPLPPFCRIAATFKPTPESDIHAEVWLPLSGWNGKLLAVGSGGWGGSIAYSAMAGALRRGYATAATDDGHTGPSGEFAMGHPEKLADFAWRAEHEMTVEAKLLIQAFYRTAPRHSYWEGCSGGGREGLIQAARYPDEFDGIIAGDPANIRRNAWALWLAVNTFKDPEAYIPPAKYPMIHRAVLAACDAQDGLADGLIEQPEACHVDLNALQCKNGDAPDCLTPRQVHTAETILSPATTQSGEVLFPRLEPGTELRWKTLAGGPAPGNLFLDEFRYIVYQDPSWDWKTFDLERDAARAHAIDQHVDELDPHLDAFAKHGGKLLLYHGWADQQVAPMSSVDFYNSVVDLRGGTENSSGWIRLFMAPGMAHCAGGEGPDTFDKLGALEDWVEHGKAPARIIATHQTAGKIDRTRPLCAYPQVARYNGTGDVNDAKNFTCRLPNP